MDAYMELSKNNFKKEFKDGGRNSNSVAIIHTRKLAGTLYRKPMQSNHWEEGLAVVFLQNFLSPINHNHI